MLLIIFGPLLVLGVWATFAVAQGRAWGALVIAGFGALVVLIGFGQGTPGDPIVLAFGAGGALSVVAAAVLGSRPEGAEPGLLEGLARVAATSLGLGLSAILGLLAIYSLNPVIPILY